MHRALRAVGCPMSRLVRCILTLTPWSKRATVFSIAIPKKHTKDAASLRAALYAAVDRIIAETEEDGTDEAEWGN